MSKKGSFWDVFSVLFAIIERPFWTLFDQKVVVIITYFCPSKRGHLLAQKRALFGPPKKALMSPYRSDRCVGSKLPWAISPGGREIMISQNVKSDILGVPFWTDLFYVIYSLCSSFLTKKWSKKGVFMTPIYVDRADPGRSRDNHFLDQNMDTFLDGCQSRVRFSPYSISTFEKW